MTPHWDNLGVHHIPHSMHSSLTEIEAFLEDIDPFRTARRRPAFLNALDALNGVSQLRPAASSRGKHKRAKVDSSGGSMAGSGHTQIDHHAAVVSSSGAPEEADLSSFNSIVVSPKKKAVIDDDMEL